MTAVSERSQSRYNRLAGLRVRKNYAIGRAFSEEGFKEALYERWGNAFRFFDARGRHGPPKKVCVASRLPNSCCTISPGRSPLRDG